MNFIAEHVSDLDLLGKIRVLLRWLILGTVTGSVVGLIGALFSKAIVFATDFRKGHDLIIRWQVS